MKYNFIEIGTSDFEALIQVSDENTIGISVEALPFYLERLPDKKNVKKVNKIIISEKHYEKEVIIFYIEPEVIDKHNLPWWIRGCSSIHKPHQSVVDLGYGSLITSKTIEAVTIKQLFEENDVESVDLLKVDTEGYDCHILQSMIEQTKIRPKRIIFEVNKLTSNELYTETLRMMIDEYKLILRSEADAVLQLK